MPSSIMSKLGQWSMRNQKKDKGTKWPGSTLAENCAAPVFWTSSLPFCSTWSLAFLRTLQPIKCCFFSCIPEPVMWVSSWLLFTISKLFLLPSLSKKILVSLYHVLLNYTYWYSSLVGASLHNLLRILAPSLLFFLFITSVIILGDNYYFNINVIYPTPLRPSLCQQ